MALVACRCASSLDVGVSPVACSHFQITTLTEAWCRVTIIMQLRVRFPPLLGSWWAMQEEAWPHAPLGSSWLL